jgi:hypothetical protein
MTNASMYVYASLEEYIKLYPKGQDDIAENHLAALHIDKKTVVFVSDIRIGVAGYKPDFSKSMVYFDQGEKAFDKHASKFEPVVGVEIIKNMVVFSGQSVTKSLAVARSYGEYKDGNVMGYILYDDTRPRLNLIMKPVSH